MKTKYWICILGIILIACVLLSVVTLSQKTGATAAEIWSDGKKLKTVTLAVEQTFTVTGKNGTNVVTVRDGTVAVTEADCPDGYCIKRGFCSGGADIVCLPNRLVIRFVGKQAVDGVAG